MSESVRQYLWGVLGGVTVLVVYVVVNLVAPLSASGYRYELKKFDDYHMVRLDRFTGSMVVVNSSFDLERLSFPGK